MTLEVLGKTYTARKFGILTTQRLTFLLMRFEEDYAAFNSDSGSKEKADKVGETWLSFCRDLFVEDVTDLDLDGPEMGPKEIGEVSSFFGRLQGLVMQRWSVGSETSADTLKPENPGA